ncbi:hypothetical protein BC938DRAFT_477642, partial [Jimgerdemannia flammicorona]
MPHSYDIAETSSILDTVPSSTAAAPSFASSPQPAQFIAIDREEGATTPAPAPTDEKDAAAKVPIPREDALHLHGTDEMSTDDVLGYFTEFGPLTVEWINDTSCNVTFPTAASAQSALATLLIDPTTAPSHTLLRKAQPYTVPSTQALAQNLHLRVATNWDVKEKGAYHRSRYYLLRGKEPTTSSSRERRERKPYARPGRRSEPEEPQERVEGVPDAYYEDLAEGSRERRVPRADVMSRLGVPVGGRRG